MPDRAPERTWVHVISLLIVHMPHFDSCQLTLIWLAHVVSFLCWIGRRDILMRISNITDKLVSSCARTIVTFDISLHEVCVRVGVRYVITKFSRMNSLPYFVTHGAPLCALRARENSASNFRHPSNPSHPSYPSHPIQSSRSPWVIPIPLVMLGDRWLESTIASNSPHTKLTISAITQRFDDN